MYTYLLKNIKNTGPRLSSCLQRDLFINCSQELLRKNCSIRENIGSSQKYSYPTRAPVFVLGLASNRIPDVSYDDAVKFISLIYSNHMHKFI